MDPQQIAPNPNTTPQAQPTIEQIAAQQAAAPNLQPVVAPTVTAENMTQPAEIAPVPGQSPIVTTSIQPPAVPIDNTVAPPAQVVHTGSVQGRTLQSQDLAQLSAADDDLIEKEWVDTVEDVIEKDEDDPSMEDIDHNTVSRAYQKQRFNLDVS